MVDNLEHKDDLAQRWRRGELADQPGVATVVLAVVLGILLLGAAVLVANRSAQARARAERESAAADLIRRVAQAGLDSFLPTEPTARYYLLKDNDRVTGFAATHLSARSQGAEPPIFISREINYSLADPDPSKKTCVMANDLSSYQLIKGTQAGSSGARLADGKLTADKTRSRRRFSQEFTPAEDLEINNLIPVALLDFFSSVVALEPAGQEFIFRAPFLIDGRIPHEVIQVVSFSVTADDNIPSEIRGQAPHGHGVSVIWPEMREDGQAMRQQIYYDPQHQIVWQKSSLGQPQIRQAVTKDELIAQFGDTARTIIRWLEADEDADEDEDAADLL